MPEFFQLPFPYLFCAALLFGVIFVNGATDAPNAIATCVCSGAMKQKSAVVLSAVCNFAGVLIMTLICDRVAVTMFSLADFSGAGDHAVLALAAALLSIIVFSGAAWLFGIPTSESHALAAGLCGASFALTGDVYSINAQGLRKVFCGMLGAVFLSFLFGYLLFFWVKKLLADKMNEKTSRTARRLQILGAAQSSFMHGAQDGQKLAGIFLLLPALARGYTSGNEKIAVPLMLAVSAVMAGGTLFCGSRIIKNVAENMVRLDAFQGLTSDIASSACLFILSLIGVPASTTHAKSAAMLGAASAENPRQVRFGVAGELLLSWLLTFPFCMLLSFLFTRILVYVFH